MPQNKNQSSFIAGNVEGDSAFRDFLNGNPEFLQLIEKTITEAARNWTRKLELTDTAEEIAQQLWHNLLKGSGGLTLLSLSVADQRRFINGAVKNQCLKALNDRNGLKAALETVLADKTLDISATCPTPEQWLQEAVRKVERQERLRTARKYLKRLTALERKVYVMRKVDGLTCRDIAAEVDLSASGVLKVYHRAETKIQRCKANDNP